MAGPGRPGALRARRHATGATPRRPPAATARAALLARVSAELSGEVDTESALGRLAQLVVPVLTDGCIVTVVDREGRARDVGSWHVDPARRPLMKQYAGVRLDSLPEHLAGRPGAARRHAGDRVDRHRPAADATRPLAHAARGAAAGDGGGAPADGRGRAPSASSPSTRTPAGS